MIITILYQIYIVWLLCCITARRPSRRCMVLIQLLGPRNQKHRGWRWTVIFAEDVYDVESVSPVLGQTVDYVTSVKIWRNMMDLDVWNNPVSADSVLGWVLCITMRIVYWTIAHRNIYCIYWNYVWNCVLEWVCILELLLCIGMIFKTFLLHWNALLFWSKLLFFLSLFGFWMSCMHCWWSLLFTSTKLYRPFF